MNNRERGRLLRSARKKCQLSSLEVQRLIGISSVYLGDVERGGDLFDNATYDRLWAFYKEHEKPPRFEGKHYTVAELRKRWDDV